MRKSQPTSLQLKQHRFKIHRDTKEIASTFIEKQISNTNLTKRFTNFKVSPTLTFAYGIKDFSKTQPRHTDELYYKRKKEELAKAAPDGPF